MANTGYVPDRVNFSCRLARRNPASQNVNIIALLKEYAAKTESLRTKLLESEEVQFARGHREATGGSLEPEVWEEFCRDGLEILERPVKGDREKKRKAEEGRGVKTINQFFSPSPKKVKGG